MTVIRKCQLASGGMKRRKQARGNDAPRLKMIFQESR